MGGGLSSYSCIDVLQDGKMDENTNNLTTEHSLVLCAFSLVWHVPKHSSPFRCHWTTYVYIKTHSSQFVPMHCLLRLVVVVLRFVFQHIEFSRSGKKICSHTVMSLKWCDTSKWKLHRLLRQVESPDDDDGNGIKKRRSLRSQHWRHSWSIFFFWVRISHKKLNYFIETHQRGIRAFFSQVVLVRLINSIWGGNIARISSSQNARFNRQAETRFRYVY